MKFKIDYASFKKKKSREEKNKFPTGTRAYKGFQGRGKSLSMTDYVYKIQQKFPNCVIFSNIKMKGLENFHYTATDKEVMEGLKFNNGSNGVINVIDECHLFCNKKTGISLDWLTQISQQRKERRKIVISSQIWEDLDVSLRKQVPEIVRCNNIGNVQINKVSNGETLRYDKTRGEYVADTIGYEIFKRNDEYFARYDTFQKIETNAVYKREYVQNTIPAIIEKNNSSPRKR